MKRNLKPSFKFGLLFIVLGQIGFLSFVQAASTTTSEEVTERKTNVVPLAVSPGSTGEAIASVPASGPTSRVGTSFVMVRINNSCFGTNLRSVSNPVSPDASIEASFTIEAGGQNQLIRVRYPGNIVALTRNPDETPLELDASELPAGSKAVAYGPTVQISIPVTFAASLTVDGGIARTSDRLKLLSSSFNQVMHGCPDTPVWGPKWSPTYACGTYMGKDGPLSVTLSPAVVAPDNSSIELSASFPRQNGFCGGFYSPLMVFFDDQRPSFTGVSDFPLNAGGKTAWPEAGAPGHFLALDTDGDGKIRFRDELFGENGEFKHGFEALKIHDSNKDGKISKADKKFKDLLLWQDANGDGKSEVSELVKLSEKIESISLKFKNNMRPIGLSAEERETSTATLVRAKGKEEKDSDHFRYLVSA